MPSFEESLAKTLADPQNQGEMSDADTSGTVGSPECGDMMRMWLKFTEKDGKKVIDKASFQAFGCQTAIAVASMATELLKGKTPEEARQLQANQLTGDLGTLPPDEDSLWATCRGSFAKRSGFFAYGTRSSRLTHPAQPN